MSDYLGLSVESDPDTLIDEALEALAVNIPGFVAREAHLEVWLLETVARMIAETRYMFTQVPDAIFRYFGQSLVNVPPVSGSKATALTTWTMIDDAGYTIPAGTQVAYRVAGDRLTIFSTDADYIVEPGETTAYNVQLVAPSVGSASNGLGPTGIELVDSLSYVQSIVADDATSGGVDPETDAAYLSRLRDELSLLTPRFVLAADAAVLARRISGVARALGIDNYDPVAETYGNEKMITVAVVGADGLPLSSGVKDEVESYLESIRELNFIVHVVDPDYTEIDVTFTVVAHSGYDLATVEEQAETAIYDYLYPANWAGGDETPPRWRTSENVVRYLEVAEVLNRVEGVHYIQSLTVDGGTANVTLDGVAPLTTPGVITGSAISG